MIYHKDLAGISLMQYVFFSVKMLNIVHAHILDDLQ